MHVLHTRCRDVQPAVTADGFEVVLDGDELVIPLGPTLRGMAFAAARRREQVRRCDGQTAGWPVNIRACCYVVHPLLSS